jgi:OPA family sugar phosphate sensor protein UhpC-like MFS transporter
MYISRYALDSWGIFYLQQAKGYTNMEAAFIYSIAPILGVLGTVFSGMISDFFFKGKRERLTLIASATNFIGLIILLYAKIGFWGDVTAMVLFGISIGILICLLGGLMAVDLAPAGATGAAMGVIGVASYLGAALQDITSGALVESRKIVTETFVNGIAHRTTVYNFDQFSIFWVVSAGMSLMLMIFIVRAYNKKYAAQRL